MITQERLKELFHYCPETGIFTWKASIERRNSGSVAGYAGALGYMQVCLDGSQYYLHRLAILYMTGSFPKEHTDHIDHNRGNNRWENIRAVSQSENLRNQTMAKNNKSGFAGVCWHKSSGKWLARIGGTSKRIHLGSFSDVNDAIAARKKADIKHGYHANHGQEDKR